MSEVTQSVIVELLKKELQQFRPRQIDAVLSLLEQGNTVPFIARYRKETTGSLDEVEIREIEERHQYLSNLHKRKAEVLRLIEEQGKLTPELKKEIEFAEKVQRVEDLYRPFKQKRRTKAQAAREKGLGPAAEWVLSFPLKGSVAEELQRYVNSEQDLPALEDVLAGVHEILAEMISDEPAYREHIRAFARQNGTIVSAVKDAAKDEKNVYEMYYQFAQPVSAMVPHRVLALNRGEKAGVLKVALQMAEESVYQYLEQEIITDPDSMTAELVRQACRDSYQRFIAPAIEREIRNELTEAADEQAIDVFGDNLRHLLLQTPMKGKTVMGFDPAYRTGCKLAIVDHTGKVLTKAVIYPHKPAAAEKRRAAAPAFRQLLEDYQVEMIAIGNGTASRESELFVAEQIKQLDRPVYYVIVNEAGASVYSASEIARAEFPDFQVEERSAVSIARRLQDPLAELVKIDPKSVGVGQYQHDVSQKRLEEKLDFVVETAVNQVGVNLNTASPALLQHVAGLNKTIATNIVTYREESGAFRNRLQLKKVPRLGPKAFEQSVGFMRIIDGENVLDNTDIHPESYPAARQILDFAGLSLADVGTDKARQVLAACDRQELRQLTGLGRETVQDILQGLTRPGRDLRDEIAQPLLRQDVLTMEDLSEGMELQGTVRNVVDFGAFVDIGVKQDGLVHISKISKGYIKHPSDALAVGDIVTVWIDSIDPVKKRIGLTMLPAGK